MQNTDSVMLMHSIILVLFVRTKFVHVFFYVHLGTKHIILHLVISVAYIYITYKKDKDLVPYSISVICKHLIFSHYCLTCIFAYQTHYFQHISHYAITWIL